MSYSVDTAFSSYAGSPFRKFAKRLLGALVWCGAETVLKKINWMIRKISYHSHQLQWILHCGKSRTNEWFDHNIDVHYMWPKTKSAHPWERGMLNSMAIRSADNVLELCSGDGFNTLHFYSDKARKLTGIDINPSAYEHATKYNASPKIDYILGNIFTDIPDQKYDTVICDATLHCFEIEKVRELMIVVKSRLSNKGIVCGHAPYLFSNAEDSCEIAGMSEVLASVFKNVKILKTEFGGRTNMHFFASDNSILPFDDQNDHIVNTRGKTEAA